MNIKFISDLIKSVQGHYKITIMKTMNTRCLSSTLEKIFIYLLGRHCLCPCQIQYVLRLMKLKLLYLIAKFISLMAHPINHFVSHP